MAQRPASVLIADQRGEVTECRDHHRRSDARERCAAIRKIADGHSPHWVASKGLLRTRDPDSVYGWLTIYGTHVIGGLLGRRHGGTTCATWLQCATQHQRLKQID